MAPTLPSAPLAPADPAGVAAPQDSGEVSHRVSIIIPVYNEFQCLDQVLRRVMGAVLPQGCEKEIIVVDDGSSDGTTELLDRFERSPLVLVHHSVVNFGKGA